MHAKLQYLLLASFFPVITGCGGRDTGVAPLAAVLRNRQDWETAFRGHRHPEMYLPGALLSYWRVRLGYHKSAGRDERISCGEYENNFVVNLVIRWPGGRGRIHRPDKVGWPPEIHCRVLDSQGRPLRFLGIHPISFTTAYSNPGGDGILEFVFSRRGRDVKGARIIVTNEEGERAFSYGSTAGTPAPRTKSPAAGDVPGHKK
ncbi:MAG: hypothetical protein ACYTFI_01780 [Planctomycetota bacterium]|jgi:hypothetical protein